MYTRLPARLVLCLIAITSPLACAAEDSPLARFLAVPGARATLPVDAAKSPFPKSFVDEARAHFDNFHAQMGGDHALYYTLHLSEFMKAAVSAPNPDVKPLTRAPDPALNALTIDTDGAGPLTLQEYLRHPLFRHQAMMMLHRGQVVFEAYPGMRPTDMHFWASTAKVTVGLVAALLAEQGAIDVDRPVTGYLPDLSGTAWDGVTVLQLLNHTTGLDTEETHANLIDPGSVVVRFFSAAFGSPNPASGKTEDVMTVLRGVAPLPAEAPGETFRYSSLNTHVLTLLIERVTGRPWAAVFEDRVWSRLGARMPAMVGLAPDGSALPMGMMASTLEDMARFGALFTPSWSAAAHDRVVTAAVLQRIRAGGRPDAFAGSLKDHQGRQIFAGEAAVSNAYQFDWIFADGAMFKSGNLQQGLYVDPERDFVGVYFSVAPYVPPYGETKAPAYLRAAARMLAGH